MSQKGGEELLGVKRVQGGRLPKLVWKIMRRWQKSSKSTDEFNYLYKHMKSFFLCNSFLFVLISKVFFPFVLQTLSIVPKLASSCSAQHFKPFCQKPLYLFRHFREHDSGRAVGNASQVYCPGKPGKRWPEKMTICVKMHKTLGQANMQSLIVGTLKNRDMKTRSRVTCVCVHVTLRWRWRVQKHLLQIS